LHGISLEMFGYKSKEFEGKFLSLNHRYFSLTGKKDFLNWRKKIV